MNEWIDLTDVFLFIQCNEEATKQLLDDDTTNPECGNIFEYPSVKQILNCEVPTKIEELLFSLRLVLSKEVNIEIVWKNIQFKKLIVYILTVAFKMNKLIVHDNLHIKINLRRNGSSDKDRWVMFKLCLRESLDGNLAYRLMVPDNNGILPGEPGCDNIAAMQLYPWSAFKTQILRIWGIFVCTNKFILTHAII